MIIDTSRSMIGTNMHENTEVKFHNLLKPYRIVGLVPGIVVSHAKDMVTVSKDDITYGLSVLNGKHGNELYLIVRANANQMKMQFINIDSKVSSDIASSYHSTNMDKELACAKSCEAFRDELMSNLDIEPSFDIRYITDARFIDSQALSDATIRNKVYYALSQVRQNFIKEIPYMLICQRLCMTMSAHYNVSICAECDMHEFRNGDESILLDDIEPFPELTDEQYDEFVTLACVYHVSQL